ncbi:hypothetical protein [uncultured Tateyamaria sp.]|uniref:hypothetical protein n=1 Tax=uncultured Tateyamaria sp. TaxID=455651 RepID=UPI00261F3802|nr:hypothetical protein [uncultured Tateyamaria sp.]
MTAAPDRLRQVSVRDFGVTPSDIGGKLLITGQRPGNIQLETAVDAGRSGTNHCLISVRRQDPAITANALVDTVTNAGYALQAVPAENASQAWAIVGAPAGTQLKVNTRRNALGQSLTGVWITWR